MCRPSPHAACPGVQPVAEVRTDPLRLTILSGATMQTRYLVILVLLGITGTMVPVQARAQEPDAEVVYDWSNGSLSAPTIRAGQRVRFTLQNVNPLCYTGDIRAEATEAKVDTKEFVQLLSGGAAPRQDTERPAVVPPASESDPGEAVVPTTRADSLRVETAATLEAAEAHLEAAATGLGNAENKRREAEFISTAVSNPPCSAGRGFSFASLVQRWEALRTYGSDPLASALEDLRSARQALQQASGLIQRAERASEGADEDEPEQERLKNAQAVWDRLRAQWETLETVLPPLRTAIRDAGRRLDSITTAAPSDMLDLSRSTERVKLTIRTHALQGTNAAALPEIVREVPVRRTFRPFFSTGVLITLRHQPNYERVNRQAFKEQTVDGVSELVPADSTYSTYANQDPSALSVFSPSGQMNVSVSGSGGVDLLTSFGVALRTVNGAPAPEPFVGFSVAVIDRLVFTGGAHFGRREQLLLARADEREEDVATRAVPAGVTDKDAIGAPWGWGAFFSVSLRP